MRLVPDSYMIIKGTSDVLKYTVYDENEAEFVPTVAILTVRDSKGNIVVDNIDMVIDGNIVSQIVSINEFGSSIVTVTVDGDAKSFTVFVCNYKISNNVVSSMLYSHYSQLSDPNSTCEWKNAINAGFRQVCIDIILKHGYQLQGNIINSIEVDQLIIRKSLSIALRELGAYGNDNYIRFSEMEDKQYSQLLRSSKLSVSVDNIVSNKTVFGSVRR